MNYGASIIGKLIVNNVDSANRTLINRLYDNKQVQLEVKGSTIIKGETICADDLYVNGNLIVFGNIYITGNVFQNMSIPKPNNLQNAFDTA
jgi:hypothetical protein